MRAGSVGHDEVGRERRAKDGWMGADGREERGEEVHELAVRADAEAKEEMRGEEVQRDSPWR